MANYYCERCNRTMNEKEFYTSNNIEAYPPDGKLHLCKKCITAHVNNWDPETYLWILKEVDVPYIPKEWNKLLASYGKDKSKVTGLTILGRYLSKMKLNQYKKYRWDDTEHLQEVENKNIEETMLRQGYSIAEIDDVINKGTFEMPTGGPEVPQMPPQDDPTIGVAAADLNFSQQIENDMISDLTDEDRRYLCMKWGKSYRPDEWVRLEELYNQMMNSYDIQQAGDINTLKMVCKTSLKANQLLDLGDVDGAQKMGKMYDTLMKQGKWTAAQNKTEENEMIDSVGELVVICERDGFIPKYFVDGPQDKADRVLQDMQKYTKDLVDNESSLGVMMERAAVQMAEEEERIAAAAASGGETDEEAMFNYEKPAFDLEDYSEFKDFEAKEAAENEAYLISLLDGEDDN